MNKANRNEIIALSLFWILYSILCVYFYQERSTYADNGYYVFTIIQHKTFCLQHGRYAAILAQWLPVMAVKAGCSLKTVLLAFSFCPILILFLLFLLVRKISTEKWITYIFLLSVVATSHHSFFVPNSEMVYGSSLLIVLAAIVRTDRMSDTQKLFYTILLILLLTFLHMFLIATALLILGIALIQKPTKIIFIIIILSFVLLAIKKIIIMDGYEKNAFNFLDWRGITLRNIHSSFFPTFFFSSIIQYFIPAIFLAVILLIQSKPSKSVLIILLLCILLLYLILMLFLRNASMKAYADSYAAMIFYFIWSVIALNIKDQNINRRQNLVLIIVLLFSFAKLLVEKSYTNRINYLESLMKDGAEKQIFRFEDMPSDIKQICWSVPYETLIVSSLNGETKTVLVKESFYKIDDYLSDSTLFLGAEWTFGSKMKLNEHYFPLKNTLYVIR